VREKKYAQKNTSTRKKIGASKKNENSGGNTSPGFCLDKFGGEKKENKDAKIRAEISVERRKAENKRSPLPTPLGGFQ